MHLRDDVHLCPAGVHNVAEKSGPSMGDVDISESSKFHWSPKRILRVLKIALMFQLQLVNTYYPADMHRKWCNTQPLVRSSTFL